MLFLIVLVLHRLKLQICFVVLSTHLATCYFPQCGRIDSRKNIVWYINCSELRCFSRRRAPMDGVTAKSLIVRHSERNSLLIRTSKSTSWLDVRKHIIKNTIIIQYNVSVYIHPYSLVYMCNLLNKFITSWIPLQCTS